MYADTGSLPLFFFSFVSSLQIVLETEVTNKGALSLYQRLGFIRIKRLYRFYLNSSDAFRLILPIPEEEWQEPPEGMYDEENRPRTPLELRPPQ